MTAADVDFDSSDYGLNTGVEGAEVRSADDVDLPSPGTLLNRTTPGTVDYGAGFGHESGSSFFNAIHGAPDNMLDTFQAELNHYPQPDPSWQPGSLWSSPQSDDPDSLGSYTMPADQVDTSTDDALSNTWAKFSAAWNRVDSPDPGFQGSWFVGDLDDTDFSTLQKDAFQSRLFVGDTDDSDFSTVQKDAFQSRWFVGDTDDSDFSTVQKDAFQGSWWTGSKDIWSSDLGGVDSVENSTEDQGIDWM